MSNYQQQLNELARSNGIKIAIFNGWKVVDGDGNVYLVSHFEELHELVRNLVEAGKSE